MAELPYQPDSRAVFGDRELGHAASSLCGKTAEKETAIYFFEEL